MRTLVHQTNVRACCGDSTTCPAEAYISGLPRLTSREVMGHLVARFGEFLPRPIADSCPWRTLSPEAIMCAWEQITAGGMWARRTQKLLRSGVRQTIVRARELGALDDEQARTLLAAIPHPAGPVTVAGRALTPSDLQRVFRAVRSTYPSITIRNRAIFALLAATGLRGNELCQIRWPLDVYDDRVILVRGKGGRQREAFVAPAAAEHFQRWLAIRGAEPGYLFCHVATIDFVWPNRNLTTRDITRIVARAAEAAGVGRLSAHDLRRTFATLASANGDLESVRRLMGHTTVASTAEYIRRSVRTSDEVLLALPALQA